MAVHSTWWIAFVIVALAVAYGFRMIAWASERAQLRRTEHARNAVGLRHGASTPGTSEGKAPEAESPRGTE